MAKRHLLKTVEISVIIIFCLIIAWLAITGILSASGVDHSWAYPRK